MRQDAFGFPIFNGQDLIDLICQGHSDKIFEVFVEDSDEIAEFNKHSKNFQGNSLRVYNYDESLIDSETISLVDTQLQSEWFMPEQYRDFDILSYLKSQCTTDIQLTRVNYEYELYITHGYGDLLKFLKYLVDFMTEANIIWGVGRGSSVASYILYLLGVHKIDSIKYKLDFNEFMR